VILLSILLVLVAAILLLPTISDTLSIARLAFRSPSVHSGAPATLPRLLLLVPAHNEELLVGDCIKSIIAARYPRQLFSTYVIADNCTDATAGVARTAGAVCLERYDLEQPGKPQAIAWALQQVPLADYDAVVILDADSVIAPGFLTALASKGQLTYKAVQAYYDVYNRTQSALTRLAAVLSAANHLFAYPLKHKAGLNAPLVGNGMCIGAHVLRTQGWRAFSICEDWEQYALLTEHGVPIDPVPSAVVYAQEAHTLAQSSTQRQRWTAGRLTVLARLALPLVRSHRIGLHQKLDAMAELTAPGPVVHLGIAIVLISLALVLGLPPVVSVLLLASLLRTMAYTVAGLCVQPDPWRTIGAFGFLPVYVLWRMITALAAIKMLGNKPWIRTPRHQHVTSNPRP